MEIYYHPIDAYCYPYPSSVNNDLIFNCGFRKARPSFLWIPQNWKLKLLESENCGRVLSVSVTVGSLGQSKSGLIVAVVIADILCAKIILLIFWYSLNLNCLYFGFREKREAIFSYQHVRIVQAQVIG